MDAARYQQVSDLFTRACAVEPESREAFLDDVCRGDDELRQLVSEFLTHDASLPDPSPIILSQPGEPGLEAGDLVRNYRVQRLLGDGGMGLVYLADQLEPIRRTVALKIMKAGLDTRSLLKRFELERHALALMDHPHIARVYDAGATEAGRPYFVMEYVAGVPITAYCDQKCLPIRTRLELFVQVAQAIQHAHQKGIIHRDIKPSNVLVTEIDGTPVPKIIDFGIARALEQTGEGETIYTQPGVMLGTPEYMSPEQALGREAPDTRADVYSLGVILYELLVGRRPIERNDLDGRTIDSLKRAIVESDPRRPSTRIRDLGPDAALPAGSRSIEAPRLERLLRADLDWIVMRAIEKDRARRYPSASELAADVERYLAGEPVTARPPAVTYRVSKYVRRHRLLITGVSAVVLTLIAGLAATTWQARRAQSRLDQIHEVSRVLVSRFHDLADQVGGMRTKESLAELAVVTLNEMSRRSNLPLEEKRALADAYEALAQVQGDSYSSSLGQVSEGQQSILKALALRQSVCDADSSNLVHVAELIKCQYLTASLHQGAPVPDGPALMRSALARSERVLARREDPAIMVQASICDILIAEMEYNDGRTTSTDNYLGHALALRERLCVIDPENAEYRRMLADIYKTISYATNDPVRSLELATRALDLNAEYERTHPFRWRGLMDLAYAHRNLGYALRRNGDLDGALAQMKRCLAVRTRMAAADTLDLRARHLVADACHLVGSAFFEMGAMDSARVCHERARTIHERMSTLPSPPGWIGYELSYTYALLAQPYAALGDTARARSYYARAIAAWSQSGPSGNLTSLRNVEEYSHFLADIGDSTESVSRHRVVASTAFMMAGELAQSGGSMPAFSDAIAVLCHYADMVAPADTIESRTYAELAEQYAVRWLGPAHPLTLRVMGFRASVLAATGDVAAARELYVDARALQPACVIAFRSTASVLDQDIRMLNQDAAGAGFTYRSNCDDDWARRIACRIKRNRIWGAEDWPVILPLQFRGEGSSE